MITDKTHGQKLEQLNRMYPGLFERLSEGTTTPEEQRAVDDAYGLLLEVDVEVAAALDEESGGTALGCGVRIRTLVTAGKARRMGLTVHVNKPWYERLK